MEQADAEALALADIINSSFPGEFQTWPGGVERCRRLRCRSQPRRPSIQEQ